GSPAVGVFEERPWGRVETVGVGAHERSHELRVVLRSALNALIRVGPGEPEAQDLAGRRVATEAQHHAHPVANARVGSREECRARADAYPDENSLRVARGERGDHGLDVLGPEP